MSLRINKDNIFFILPEDRYSVSKRIDKYMAEDFTLYVKSKVNHREMENDKDYFMFSRNGMHSGISIYKDKTGCCHACFCWWIINENGENEYKSITRLLDDSLIDEHNEYLMICDDKEQEINCYLNNELIGSISYKNNKKHIYDNTFYWFGCGSMMCVEEQRRVGDFDFDLTFLLNKKLEINEAISIIANYKKSHTTKMFDGLLKLKDDFYLKDNFAFFCDFDNSTRYKIWDMTFSGNYPQIYIEDNIYF